MLQIFRGVVTTVVVDDGLTFDATSVKADEIREDNAYGGVRVRLLAKLGPAEIPVQIDIGVGDVVTPAPENAAFPTLLDFPAPQLRVYPVYTVVAEKFEAMVKLGMGNTRMKDFHDVWFLARRFELDPVILRQAIEATFARRQTKVPQYPEPFGEVFANDPTKQIQWAGFLRRNGLTEVPNRFSEIVAAVRQFIEANLHRSGN